MPYNCLSHYRVKLRAESSLGPYQAMLVKAHTLLVLLIAFFTFNCSEHVSSVAFTVQWYKN